MWHGEVTRHVVPLSSANFVSWFPQSSGYLECTTAGLFSVHVEIPVCEGDRVKLITAAVFGNAAADFTISTKPKIIAADGTLTDLPGAFSGVSFTNPPASWGDIIFTVDSGGYVIAAGESLFYTFEANATGLRIGSLRYVVDRGVA